MGISAIYEYAATAIAEIKSGASLEVTIIAVGPSAPPIIAIAAAAAAEKPRTEARINAINMPNCAPAPISILLGFAINGPKSVIAPIPRNISGG